MGVVGDAFSCLSLEGHGEKKMDRPEEGRGLRAKTPDGREQGGIEELLRLTSRGESGNIFTL